MTLYKNKYRSESIRLKNWDYSSNGYYFVTICTKNKTHFFGEIINGEMILSDIGKIAYQNLSEIPNHFKNIEIDEFVIMPNHVHLIIIINNEKICEQLPRRDVIYNVSTNEPQSQKNEYFSNLSPSKNTLSVVIRTYKASVTRDCKKNNLFLEWQQRFYENIIKEEESLDTIKKYIKNNPLNWSTDSNNPNNNSKNKVK